MGLGENLRRLREKKGLNMRQISEILEIKYTTYVGWDTGKRGTSTENLKLLADFFHVSIDYLLSGGDTPAVEVERETMADKAMVKDEGEEYRGPLVVRARVVRALLPPDQLFLEENFAEWVIISQQLAADGTHFAYRFNNDRLRDKGIYPGDLLIIRREETVPSGSIAAVYTQLGGMICLYYKVDGGVVVLPGNLSEPAFFKDGDGLTVMGRVVECRRTL